jgi:hypothetical protein
MKALKVFIASPGDVKKERDLVSLVVEELSRGIGDALQVRLEAIRWETNSWPDVGEDAQDVINRQIGGYDVLVGIMWKRFGTPTHRASSGTEEEFERAFSYFKKYKRPKIMFYFRTSPFYTADLAELSQFTKVIRFREKLVDLGVLFWEYDTLLQFERSVREHLTKQVFHLTGLVKEEEAQSRIFFNYAREDREQVESIYNSLASAGLNPWMDIKDINPGEQWVLSVERAIREADFFVVFLSINSVNKRGFVQRELKSGLDMVAKFPIWDIFMIPVRLDPVDPPERLKQFQWIDLFEPDGLKQLITALRMAQSKRNKAAQ